MNLQFLFLFDISTILLMIIIANLSNRYGNAMKIKPFYKVLYGTSFMVICASIIDFISVTLSIPSLTMLSLSIRFLAGVAAFIICLIYWKWLFSAFKN